MTSTCAGPKETTTMELDQDEVEIIKFLRAAKTMDASQVPMSVLNIPVLPVDAPEAPSTASLDWAQLHIPKEQWPLCTAANEAVLAHMSQYDNSHNYEHIQRVCTIGRRLYLEEKTSNPSWAKTLDTTTLFLALMVHDVGDAKYIPAGSLLTGEQKTINLLTKAGASLELAQKIWTIADTVSYTAEMKNPQRVHDVIAKYPELAIVQDCDRLDALGAVGLARCFAYGGWNVGRQRMTLDRTLYFVWYRFFNYLSMMKTEAGRKMARERWPAMVVFWRNYVAEADVSSAVQQVDDNVD